MVAGTHAVSRTTHKDREIKTCILASPQSKPSTKCPADMQVNMPDCKNTACTGTCCACAVLQAAAKLYRSVKPASNQPAPAHLSLSELAAAGRLHEKTVLSCSDFAGLSSSVQPVPLFLSVRTLIRLNAARYCCIEDFSSDSWARRAQAGDRLAAHPRCELLPLPSAEARGQPLLNAPSAATLELGVADPCSVLQLVGVSALVSVMPARPAWKPLLALSEDL